MLAFRKCHAVSSRALTPFPLPTESLTLIKEKQNAHTGDMFGSISSVQFSPDGTKIVSAGMKDQTIKVWDSGER